MLIIEITKKRYFSLLEQIIMRGFMRKLFFKISLVFVLFGWFSICLAQNNENTNQSQNTLPNSPNEICPILIGESVPKLELTKIDGSSFNLNAAIEQKPTILIFYRGGW